MGTRLPEDEQHHARPEHRLAEPEPAPHDPGRLAASTLAGALASTIEATDPDPHRVAVVANPTSGGGKGGKLIPRVEARLTALGIHHTILRCAGPEDPEPLARQAAEGGATIVAALGGDGQISAVANGILGTGAALAVIPAGSGNDFARSLGLDRKHPLAAVDLLAGAPRIRHIDVVKVSTPERDRHYVNIGSVGFDSEVNDLANQTRFPLGGTPKYIYSVFVTLAKFSAGSFTLVTDGESRTLSGMLIAVGNAPSYGGGMRVCPDAVLDDGVLDVCVLGKVSKLAFIKAFPRVFKGTHTTHPAVTMLRGRTIEISADRPYQVYADGERVGKLPATFTVQPGVLPVVRPAAPG